MLLPLREVQAEVGTKLHGHNQAIQYIEVMQMKQSVMGDWEIVDCFSCLTVVMAELID